MKKIILALSILFISSLSFAQKGSKQDTTKKVMVPVQKKFSCDSINVNFETGLLNGKVGPSSPIDSIKKYLPCVSSEIPMGSDDHICGGGAALEKQGIFFNLEHGFIEFSSSTTAYLPVKPFGVLEDDLAAAMMSDPAQITDLTPYADRPTQSVYLYQKVFGSIAVWVDQKDKKVFKVQMHNQPPAKVYLCIE